jgi:hypothetical protein
VNDTSPEMDKMVAERYKLMTLDRRMRIASSAATTHTLFRRWGGVGTVEQRVVDAL